MPSWKLIVFCHRKAYLTSIIKACFFGYTGRCLLSDDATQLLFQNYCINKLTETTLNFEKLKPICFDLFP